MGGGGATHFQCIAPGEAPIEDAAPTLSFEEGNINGTTGCNGYFGSYTLDGTNLTIGQVGQTEMYCDGRMEQEQAYLQMLMAAFALSFDLKLSLTLQFRLWCKILSGTK